jgi:hypothetical protein
MTSYSFATFEENLDACLRWIVAGASDTTAGAFEAAEMVLTIDRKDGT